MNKQTALKILGALLLGALGNGVWELIKPAFTFAGSATVSIISLGFDSAINEIFERVGHANIAAIWVSSSTLALISFGVLAFIVVNRSYAGSSFPRVGPLNSLILLAFVGASMFGAYRHMYVASERNYFENLMRASAPYLTPEQRLVIESRLVLVKTKADYEKLVQELQQTLNAHGLEYKRL